LEKGGNGSVSDLLGNILYVDLGSGEIKREPFTVEMAREYIGGRGLAARLLWDMNKAGIDPLGPGNTLIYNAGTLNGTSVPCSGRSSVTAKSPTSNLYLKTNVGGAIGGYLRYTGNSLLVITGRSEKPVYLWIDDDEVEIRDASHIWGKDVRETESILHDELGDPNIKFSMIGPAGENMVMFAAVMCSNYNAAGRAGGGAVMGSKNLKAIAVRGTKPVRVAEPQAFKEAVDEVWEKLAEQSGARGLHLYGTSGGLVSINEINCVPTKNYQVGHFDEAAKVCGPALVEGGYLKRRVACFSCALGCHRYAEVGGGKYAGTYTGGPEYEAFSALGTGPMVSDIEAVLKANEYCNIYGMDVISTGSLVQWIIECNDRGLEFDREGLDLSWGNGDTLVEVVRRIAFREGKIGDLLAKGVKRASEEMGQDSYQWAVQAKGLEQSRVETRSAYSYALAFAVNPRGPDHLMTETIAEFGLSPEAVDLIEEITGDVKYADSRSTGKRAEIVRWHEDTYCAADSLGICAFTNTAQYFLMPELMAKLFSATIGVSVDEDELMRLGRKIVTLEKAFNVREGATRKDDTAPWRLMHEPQPDSPQGEDAILSQEKLDKMLDRYYELHEWDNETSWPTHATLEKLDMGDVADELGKMGKLP
jgi:aldehyde:ferredoxin oxidoreductase